MKKNIEEKLKGFIDFDDYLKEELKDPEFKKLFDEEGRKLKIVYQISQLRKIQNISQNQLAKKIGTTQSAIARIETGNQNITIEMLQKIAVALKSELKIEFVK